MDNKQTQDLLFRAKDVEGRIIEASTTLFKITTEEGKKLRAQSLN
jgi:hypothetical protein